MNSSAKALIVIDVQRGLFDGAVPEVGVPFEAHAVVERINSLAAQARNAGVPVIWVQHERAEGFLSHGSPEWELHPALKTDSSDARVFKTTPDSFLRTGLQRLLEVRGAKEVVICGYASEFCVDTTTRRAAALGYPVTLVSDAHTTADKPHATGEQIRAHENATLPKLTSFGPKICALPTAYVGQSFAPI
jgi:nicotinamidase-related amidase